MMTGRIIARLACAILAVGIFACPADALAASKSKKKKAAEETPAPPKKTPYEKFISKKGIESTASFMKLYRDKADFYLEIPDSLMGRRILVTSRLVDPGTPLVASAAPMGKNAVYRMSMTDSLVVLTTPGSVISSEDGNITSALDASSGAASVYAFPIAYRNADSTAVVVKVTSLLNDSKKINLKGRVYDAYTISGSTLQGDQRVVEMKSADGRITVVRDATWELALDYGGNEVLTKPRLTGTYSTSINLLEDKPLTARKADSRVGTQTFKVKSYRSTGEIRSETYAYRWDLSGGRKITIYVDTLFSESWAKAIKEGLESWNEAFEAVSLGSPIEVLPLTADIDSDDPLVSVAYYRGGTTRKAGASITVDNQGDILSCNIRVPGDYVNGVRQASVYQISDVDRRFARYDISDEVVCEVLKADMMKVMGTCLGFLGNTAGSYAYSPEQLRDPAFTQANGITASVTDDVLFNTLARPGDKERGVVTMIDRIGSYDRYAVAWLYADAPADPSQLFIGKQSFPFDPRGIERDLGNDPLECFNSVLSHARNVASMCMDWIVSDDIPEPYTYLFVDWLWLNWGNNAFALMKNVGGMYVSDIRDSDGSQRFTAVPAELQKACLDRFFASLEELDYITPELIHTAGLNKSVEYMTYSNINEYAALRIRLLALQMSCEVAGCTYTPDQFMADYQKRILANVRRGVLHDGEILSLQKYISMLVGEAPVMKQNLNEQFRKNGFSFDGEAALSAPDGIPGSYLMDIRPLCIKYLQSTAKILRSGVAAAKDDFTRRQIEFLCYMVDGALNGPKD